MTIRKQQTLKNRHNSKAIQAVNLLKERYNDMPNWKKETFLTEIMSQTGRHKSTVFLWIRGGKPCLAEQKILADYLGESVQTLFNHLNP